VDPFTGRNPSYCFVDLESKEQAEKAMTELDAKELLGRSLRIKPGVVRSADQQSRSSPSSPSGTVDRWRRQETPSLAKTNGDSSQRVYVGGLPRISDQETAQSQIRSFFDGYTVYVGWPWRLLTHQIEQC
jgi:RNA recognition motif-containing protein